LQNHLLNGKYKRNLTDKVISQQCLLTSKKEGVGRKKLDGGKLRDKIIVFLESLTTYEAHYVIDSAPHRKYLNDPTIGSIADVEKFFRLCAANSSVELGEFSSDFFRRIFVSEFNIAFKSPNLDECSTCLWYESHHVTSSEAYIVHKFQHKLSARYYKASINSDSIPENTEVISLDLARMYDSPFIEGGTYYGAQESLRGQGIIFHKSQTSHLAVWSQTMGGRGTDSISSSLLKVIRPVLLKDPKIEEILVFADNCGGQNKSRMNIVFWNMLLNEIPQLKKIHLNYIFKGNKGFRPDSLFSVIRRQMKKDIPLECPEAFYRCFERAQTKPSPIVIHRMKTEDFKSFLAITEEFTSFLTKTSRNQDEEGNHMAFIHVSQFLFDKRDPLRLGFRYTSYPEEPFKRVPFFRTDSFSSKFVERKLDALPLAYPNGIPIAYKTAKDLSEYYTKFTRTEEAQKHFKFLKDNHFSAEWVDVLYQRDVVDANAMNEKDEKIVYYNDYRPKEYEVFKAKYLKKFSVPSKNRKLIGVRRKSKQNLPGRDIVSLSTSPSSLSSSVSTTDSSFSSPISCDSQISSSSPGSNLPPSHSDNSSILAIQSFPSQTPRMYFCMMCQTPLHVEFQQQQRFCLVSCSTCTYIHQIQNPARSTVLDPSMLHDLDTFEMVCSLKLTVTLL
jgi:hypothetical protein